MPFWARAHFPHPTRGARLPAMPYRLIFLLALASAMLGFYPGSAEAEVRRCVTPSGQAIFTDRKCDEVGAVERLPREHDQAGAAHVYRGSGCARNLQDLVFEMTTAIDAHDSNRLASIYHWAGMSGETGYQIWNRLDAIANRPLVDIVPVMPAASPPTSTAVDDSSESKSDGTNSRGDQTTANTQSGKAVSTDAELYPQTAVRRNPVALRVEQTLANGATPSRTVFGLTRHFGCWWVRF